MDVEWRIAEGLDSARLARMRTTFAAKFGGKHKFDPDCDKVYTMHVHNVVEVVKCDNVSDAQIKQMIDELYAKAERACGAICALSSKGCNKAKLLDWSIVNDTCEGKFWTIDAVWNFKCV